MTGAHRLILVLLVLITDSVLYTTSQYTPSSPPPLTEAQRQRTIAALESSLLKLFGLQKRPPKNREIVVPQYMIDLYRQETGDEGYIPSVISRKGTGYSNTVRSFHHEDVEHAHGCGPDNCARLWFNVSYIPQEELLTAAELRVHIKRNHSDVQDTNQVLRHKLQVFEIMKPISKDVEPISRLIDVKDVVVQNSSWVSLDVHPAVLKWKKKQRFNHGLEIRVVSHKNNPSTSPLKHVRLRRAAELESKDWEVQRPLLVAYTDDGKGSSRTKRNATEQDKKKKKNKRKKRGRKCEKGKKGKKCRRRRRKNRRKNKNENGKDKEKPNPPGIKTQGHKDLCSRKPLYVDFDDVGWDDWIVAPLGYDAYYCDGKCPFPLADNMNTTNHAIVQTLVNSGYPRAAPPACCVPTSLSSISMLYMDEFGKVILKQYDEMVVEGCGCR